VAAFRRTVDALAALGACASPKGSSRRATDTSTHSDQAVRRRIFTRLPQLEETVVWVQHVHINARVSLYDGGYSEGPYSPGSTRKGIGGPFPLVYTLVDGSTNRRLFVLDHSYDD
jgi:hypothetical protein